MRRRRIPMIENEVNEVEEVKAEEVMQVSEPEKEVEESSYGGQSFIWIIVLLVILFLFGFGSPHY